MGTGYRHYAGLAGTKMFYVGSDESSYMYQTVEAAVTAAQANDCIVLAPGTYTLASQLLITKPLRMIGLGGNTGSGVVITCEDDIATSMISVELTAQAAAAYLYFENIKFLQADDDLDIFDVNNTSVAQNLELTFSNCSFYVYDSASTGKAIDIAHATAGKSITLNIGSNKMDYMGCINATFKNAGDLIKVVGMQVVEDGNASGIITSADDLAAGIVAFNCLFTHEKATSGGHGTQTVKVYGCKTAAAVVDTNDLIGSHTETIA